MNNCPKCGNPLQAGVTSCPICGTNISVENETKQVTVESVAQTPAPAVEPAPVAETAQAAAPAPAAEPAQAAASTPVESAPAAAPIMPTVPAPTEPKEEPAPAQPVQPTVAPVEAAPVATETPVAQPAEPAPVAQPIEPAPAVQQATPAPAAQPIEPTPVQPAITPTAGAPVVNASVEPEKPKKKKNKLAPLLIVLLLAALGGGAYFYFFSGTTQVQQPPAPVQNNIQVATKEIIANGFDLKVAEGWIVREADEDVLITNENETVIIKLSHSSKNIEAFTETSIKNYLETRGAFSDIEVKTSKINANDTFVVDAMKDDKPFQLYLIDGGTNLMIGVAVVYTGKVESKTVNEATVQEIIGSISYSYGNNDNVNINSTYPDIMGSFSGLLNSSIYVEEQNQDAPETTEETGEGTVPSEENNGTQPEPTPEQPVPTLE